MASILGISGSLRAGSFNSALLRAAQTLSGDGAVIEVGSIRGIPVYDADVEAQGIPAPVAELKDKIAQADGLLLVSPEYNHSVPGSLKNAIDWVSRPSKDIPRIFGGLPVAVTGASAGGFGTVLAQDAWLPVLHTLGTLPWFGGRLLVSRASKVFDERGKLVDEEIRERLRTFVHGFARFVDAHKRARA